MPKKKLATEFVVHVALKAPRKPADLVIYAQVIHDAMAANAATFPTPDPPLTVFQAGIDDLTSTEVAVKRVGVGGATRRNTSQRALSANLKRERAYVQGVAAADPENAALIAARAGMSLWSVPSRNKPILVAKTGRVSGILNVITTAIKGATGYQWQHSLDGGKTWIDMPATTKAQTTLANLTPKATVWFRVRALVRKTGFTDWSQSVSAVVS
jgi:hypothetical protein